MRINSSDKTGTANSAAAVGVAARTSATTISDRGICFIVLQMKSPAYWLDKWPRATRSSLNGHKSSIDPPPRPMIIVSKLPISSTLGYF